MRELQLKTVRCTICGDDMLAKRADKNRCKKCRSKYLVAYRKLPTTRARRANNHRLLMQQAFNGYGGRCSCCGESQFEFLALDHVNGGGRKDREKRATSQIARYVIDNNFPTEFQVLCHNCNQAKGWFGLCPHKR